MLYALILVCYFVLGLATPFEQAPVQAEHDIPPPPRVAPSVVRNLPLDTSQRAALQSALRNHDYDAAESSLVSEIQKNPKSRQLLAFLGSVSFLNGNYLNAAIALKKAEALSPLDERDRFVLALAYVALKRPDWARPELEKLARLDQMNALYPFRLGLLLEKENKTSEAIRELDQAVAYNSGYPEPYYALGRIYQRLGDEAKAKQEFATFEKLKELKAKNAKLCKQSR